MKSPVITRRTDYHDGMDKTRRKMDRYDRWNDNRLRTDTCPDSFDSVELFSDVGYVKIYRL